MQIDLYDIFSSEKLEENIVRTLAIDEVQYSNEKVTLENGVTAKIKIEKLNNDEFLITGTLNTILLLNCDRCSDDVKYLLDIDLSKVISLDIEDDEEEFIKGHYLDLEKFVLNEIYLNFPMKVLCKDDCKGICKECGTNLNVNTCNCNNEDIDPRLIGLKAIFDKNFKEV